MRTILFALIAVATPSAVLAQRPDIPPQRIEAPELSYAPVTQAEAFDLPAGLMFDQVAAMDIDARGPL